MKDKISFKKKESIMRRTTFGIFFVGMLAVLAMTFQLDAFSSEEGVVTFRGDIMDNMCANASKDNLAEFVKTHTKECVLMTHCVASGFSIYADGKLLKFDEASNKKIEEFLNRSASKLQVVIIAKKSGEEYSLVSIKNQK